MDIGTFYAVTSAACFALVGLWWSVVANKAEWFTDEVLRRLAGSVTASFLIPALMSMAAQVGSTSHPWIWQGTFILSGALGMYSSSRLIQDTRLSGLQGPFSRNRWAVPVLYGGVILFALFPGLARLAGLQPLQMEGLLLTALIMIAHMLAWEFMTYAMQK